MTRLTELPQVKIPAGVIHLGLGQPGNDLLPARSLAQAAERALKDDDASYLAYGQEQGNINFLQTLAAFLSAYYPGPVDPDSLLITNGNSQALDFICRQFTQPGDTVLVEEPSYFLALKIFADHKLNLVTVPMDEHGLCIKDLEKTVKKLSPSFLYIIPTHHNPAGVTLNRERRDALAAICKKHDLPVVADEVYHFLTFEKEKPIPMGCFSDQGPVISLGSFSKILAPGLRLGWVQAAPGLIKKMTRAGVMISGGGFNPFTSQVVDAYIQQGLLDTNITSLNKIFHRRMKTMCKALKESMPPGVRYTVPDGGYFVWVELPGHINAEKLRKKSQDRGVDFLSGNLFSHKGHLKNFIRLGFCFYDEAMIKQGVKRLSEMLFQY